MLGFKSEKIKFVVVEAMWVGGLQKDPLRADMGKGSPTQAHAAGGWSRGWAHSNRVQPPSGMELRLGREQDPQLVYFHR